MLFDNMPLEQRRAVQEQAGLEVVPREPVKEVTMNSNEVANGGRSKGAAGTQPSGAHLAAAATLERLAKAESFRAIAMLELKRAAVWAPILLVSVTGALWAHKRWLSA